MKRIAVLLLAGLTLVACARKGEEPAAVRTEIVDGVTLVHNPAVPLHPEKTVRLDYEISFATAEEGPGAVFKPGAFAVDGAGHVLIYDASDRAIKVFDPAGAFVRAIGRGGEGPGEFSDVQSMAFLPDGRLMVMDAGTRRTSLFDAAGEYAGGYTWKTFQRSPSLALENSYSAIVQAASEDKAAPLLKTYDFQGNEIRPGLPLTSNLHTVTRQVGEAVVSMGVNVPFGARSLLADDPVRRRLYHCLNNQYLIEVYDESGRVIRKIDRPYTPLPFPASEREEFVSGVISEKASQQTKEIYAQLPYPDVKTIAEKMFTDDRGYLWLMTNETRTEEKVMLKAYDVFDVEGVYDARVWLEADARVWLFAGGKLYLYEWDSDTDLTRLNRYKVVWEGEEKS